MKDEKIELNPCKCGSKEEPFFDHDGRCWYICDACGNSPEGTFKTKELAFAAWNRLNPPAQPALKEANSQNNPSTTAPTEAEVEKLAEHTYNHVKVLADKTLEWEDAINDTKNNWRHVARLILTLRATDQATIASQAERARELSEANQRANALIGAQADANDKLVGELNAQLTIARADIKRKDSALAECQNWFSGRQMVNGRGNLVKQIEAALAPESVADNINRKVQQ